MAALPQPDVTIYRVPFASIVQDHEIKRFETEVQGAIRAAPSSRLAIDLTKTFHISSRALGLLVAFRRELKANGGRLVLFGANAAVQKVMQVTRLNALIPILVDERLATAMLQREDQNDG